MAYQHNSTAQSASDKAIEKFTEMMINRLEEAKDNDWKRGWIGGQGFQGLPQNLNGRNYSGTNSLFLFMDTAVHKYAAPVYLTFLQKEKEGLRLKKGSQAMPVIYWDMSIKDANGKKISVGDYKNMTKVEKLQCEVHPFLRSFRVYNIDQTNMQEVNKEKYDQIIARFQPPKLADTEGMYRNAAIDRMFERQEWLCRIQYDKASEQAYFKPSLDMIVLPLKAQFKISKTPDDIYKDGMEYYSTALHEMAHSTGTPERLDRNVGNKFGDAKYGKEELVAELSAAMVGNTMGFDRRIQNNNVAYVDSWLKALREEPKFIVSVMADVNKASNMILQKIDEQKLALGETPILGIQQEGKSEQTQNTKPSSSAQDQVDEVAKSTVKASIYKLPSGTYVIQASVNGQELDQKPIDNKTAVTYLRMKDNTKMDQMLSDIVKEKYGSELNLPRVNRNESRGLKI
ncbi:MAG: DUF1738 domain-containing protein [Prevotella sp.]|jgi:putative DNA primase|nr:DUF1738 domain-containing protein [Prevotella sp.]